MKIAFICDKCKVPLEAEPGWAGCRINCPQCRAALTVPTVSSLAAPTSLTHSPARYFHPIQLFWHKILKKNNISVALILKAGASLP